MSEDGPVLDPTEFDIEDDERVREIGTDRYVVSASDEPPAPSTDRTAGEATNRADRPSDRRDTPANHAGGETTPPRGAGGPPTDQTTRADATRGAGPTDGAATGVNGRESRNAPARGGGMSGARDAGPGERDPPTSESTRQRGARAAGGAADRGATGGGWDRDEPTGRAEPHGGHDATRTGGNGEPDAAAVSRWLADSLRDNGFAYGFDATVSMDGEVSRHRTVSDDVTEAFETLAVWFARNASDGDPERALGVLVSQMDTSVELPPDLIRQAAVEHDLSADDSIRELLQAVREDGHVTLE